MAKDTVRKNWSHLLVPTPAHNDPSVVTLEHFGMRPGAQRTSAEFAWDKASDQALITTTLGRRSFRERMLELWPQDRPDIPVDQLRDWYFEFLHRERLRDEVVLASSISDAVADMDPTSAKFALAGGKTDDDYQELQFSKNVPVRFGQNMLIVQRDVAETVKQRAQPAGDGAGGPTTGDGSTGVGGQTGITGQALGRSAFPGSSNSTPFAAQ